MQKVNRGGSTHTMRLIKIKLSGFKSFVDPTTISFPGSLTGVVGPNGCGKSNIIDAVRWVMGELSARYLRGDSMADVVFNGSVSRKPVGAAAVELIFDNSEGKIGGPYASYSEISLRRTVGRDGTSGYFINGARCRRKDITQLFLGTGLGSRSYAIIEQGTISRVIEAKPEDMRALLEEAAGISRYKERRRETESRVADTRENLERLQDVRDEVEKQIRHLQRQAATARRYQALKDEERRAAAELLALKLRELDRGAEVHDSATRERDLAMQAALAEQRSAEAVLERQRAIHAERTDRLSQAQGRYYEAGADVTRTEQAIEHARELRERQRSELAQTRTTLAELAAHIDRDEQQISALRAELAELQPQLADAQRGEHDTAGALALAEHQLAAWQQRWEEFIGSVGAANQGAQIERVRIEQLELQIQGLTARADRLAGERAQLAAQASSEQLGELGRREGAARERSEELSRALATSLEAVKALRSEQLEVEEQLEAARAARERLRGELVSLEALQKAALAHNGSAEEWLGRSGLGSRPRVAETLEVEPGWESAVETALGEDLEAVCVEQLDELVAALEGFSAGRLALFEQSEAAASSAAKARDAGGSCDLAPLAAKIIRGPAAVRQQLSDIFACDSLAASLRRRATLAPGESLITRQGEWVGKSWIRLRRGPDRQTGVIEREHRLKLQRGQFGAEEQRVGQIEARLASIRGSLGAAERDRDRAQSQIHSAHREHAELAAQLEGARARSEETTVRRARLDEESGETARETAAAREALERARAAREQGLASVGQLESGRPTLEAERDARREQVAAARVQAQQAQLAARDLIVRSESRRSSEASMSAALARMLEQRTQLTQRHEMLERELAGGDAPVQALQERLNEFLSQRLTAEGELGAARRALEEAEAELRVLDERRMGAEQRVLQAREAMEAARLAAQETRVRREAIAEQFAASGFELAGLLQALPPEADWTQWEQRLVELRASVERLGQVNLAAIDELKEQTERKDYLDRQFTDLTDALTTLDEAMRRIDKETRTRFEETFERINSGLKEKFPRLFGGGHAYLELVGEDVLTAGVAVMARPPGKRNSTIHLLSGGEKALTAVALVFSIFDLNPAPFCLLDEVDAPLDEYNIGRFCEIVRDMSSRVQFIFVTHNKATMELASHLIGVTMSEPGVSRLVAVDVEAAMRLAAV
jgi:chromosome segregation protein